MESHKNQVEVDVTNTLQRLPKPPNTFGIDVCALRVLTAHSEAELLKHWQQASAQNQAVLVLGSGSNVLFIENFDGTVLLNRIYGIKIADSVDAWILQVGAGEVWHDLVTFCLDREMSGLENLALIPGRVGAAPVQNIGAYGVELQQLCDYVDVIHLKTDVKFRLSTAECKFGFRDSIFKHELRDCHAIVAVGLRLKKAWQPILSYGELKRLNAQQVTPRQIYDAVCALRRQKIPDPAMIGNAGSFFKNPIISAVQAECLLRKYADCPYYPQENGRVKLAAGWLIENCNLKGFNIGGAAVYDQHALVLINTGKASGGEIATLAHHVRQQVADRFDIWLEPEVRFITRHGEVDAVTVISE